MYNHQRIYVNQVIYNFWICMQEGILDKIRRRGKPVRITGDGQYDSPGHNARYCFYTMIESVSKLVVDFYMAEKTMVSGNFPFFLKVYYGSISMLLDVGPHSQNGSRTAKISAEDQQHRTNPDPDPTSRIRIRIH
jgi:hypothetical protein